MENFLNGEVYCKSIDYFTESESKDLRGDKYEGSAYLKQIKNLTFKHEGNVFASALSGQLYGRNPKEKGNIFCLYGISSDHIDFENKTTQKLNVDIDGVSFADTAVLIYDPIEFIRRVEKVVQNMGFECDFSPVIYYDEKSYEGELTPFHKRMEYKSQSEVRFWIPNKLEGDLRINIGNISDISGIFPKEMMTKLDCEPL